MMRRLAAVLCLLTAAQRGVGRAEEPPTPPSPALAKLLADPAVDPKARAYFDALPARAHELTEKAIAGEVVTGAQHLAAILSLAMPPSVFEAAMEDRCFLCHSDPEVHTGDTLFSPDPAAGGHPKHMDLTKVVQDVHFRRGLSCAGCHGGDPTAAMDHDHPASWPTDSDRRHTDRRWIPEFCSRCHADSAFMRQFNPGMPTDQLAKYRQSQHGIVLAAGDSRAAQCVSCHGVHGIQGAKSPRSSVYPSRVPETCGACHADAKLMAGFKLPDGSPLPTNQLEEYRASVHGKALLERGDLGAPACNDCHGNHAAMPPQVASVAEICRTCHARNGTLFDGSKHKEAFVKHHWPECNVCHGKHSIARTSDAMLAPDPGALCQACHDKYATNNPACKATATYFHAELLGLSASLASFTDRAELVARRGLDADPMHDQLLTLSDSLKQSRSYIHAFDRSEFNQATAPGHASIASLVELEKAAEGDLLYRRVGLAIAVVLIALLMLLLWLKVRRMESGDR